MTNPEYLELLAAGYIDQHLPLPIDLVMKMSAAGMEVERIEQQLIKERDLNNG
jgi:hypothetical protein